MKKCLVGCLLLLLASPSARAAASREFLHVAPKVETPPVIDGNLDEDAWKKAPVFRLATPPTSSRIVPNVEEAATTVRMLHDANGLYLGLVCQQKDLHLLKASVKGRDSGTVWEDDSLELFLSPLLSKINYYKFEVNSLAAFSDIYRYDAVLSYNDWNALNIQVAAGRLAEAWTIEFFVSWKDLATVEKTGEFIGFQMVRFLWKGSELHANGSTGGNYARPKMGFVYLADASAPALRPVAEKMDALIPGPWYVLDGEEQWIFSDKRRLLVEAPQPLEERLAAELDARLATLPALKEAASALAKEPDRRKRFEQILALLDQAAKAVDTKELQRLLE